MSLADINAKLTGANAALSNITGTLNTVSQVVQNIETNSTTGTTPLTGAQKLGMAVDVIGALDPEAGALGKTLETIIGTFVTLFNLTGLFKKSA
jgi:hypothetical protein